MLQVGISSHVTRRTWMLLNIKFVDRRCTNVVYRPASIYVLRTLTQKTEVNGIGLGRADQHQKPLTSSTLSNEEAKLKHKQRLDRFSMEPSSFAAVAEDEGHSHISTDRKSTIPAKSIRNLPVQKISHQDSKYVSDSRNLRPSSSKATTRNTSDFEESTIDASLSSLLSNLIDRRRNETKTLCNTERVGNKKIESFSISDALPKSLLSQKDKIITTSETDRSFEQYLEIMDPILESTKWLNGSKSRPKQQDAIQWVAGWLRNPKPILHYKENLKTFQTSIYQHISAKDNNEQNVSSPSNSFNEKTADCTREQFLLELKTQEEEFLKQQEDQIRLNSSYSESSNTKFDIALAHSALSQACNMCARNARGMPATVIWQKVKEIGCSDQKLLQTLLYVSSTFTTASSLDSTGQIKKKKRTKSKYHRLISTGMESILDALDSIDEADEGILDDVSNEGYDSDDMVDMINEIAIYHDLLHNPTEASICIRVRLLVSHGRAKEAEHLILANALQKLKNEDTVEIRLRACAPVLRLHLEQGNLSAALTLYQRMQSKSMPLVFFDVETYSHLLAGLAEHGAFHMQGPKISKGSAHSFGPRLFDRIAKDMARDIIEVPEQFMKRLYDAFAKSDRSGTMEVTTSLAPLQPSHKKALDGMLVASRVRIDPTIGKCPRTGVRLRLIALTENQKERLKSSILNLAKTGQEQFHNKLVNHDRLPMEESARRTPKSLAADKNLLDFQDWLDRRRGEPYTAIIDGANVGYYFQNFQAGRFSYHQIHFVVTSLEKMGEAPLVIIPSKYTRDSFYTSIGISQKQYLTKAEKRIRNELMQKGKLFPIPPRCLDDYYWILASISSQTESKRTSGRDSLTVTINDPRGRWPGTRPILITNDRLRDHRVDMLEPMLFLRWCNNYIVNYNFAPFVNGECSDPEIGFAAADFFSREIQGNTDETGSMVWHFPIHGKEDEWFCVRLPRKRYHFGCSKDDSESDEFPKF